MSRAIYIEGDGHNTVSGNTVIGYDEAVHIKGGVRNEVDSNFVLSLEAVKLYEGVTGAIAASELSEADKAPIFQAIAEMRDATGSPSFSQKYKDFVATLADHMAVLGPVISPFLAGLACL